MWEACSGERIIKHSNSLVWYRCEYNGIFHVLNDSKESYKMSSTFSYKSRRWHEQRPMLIRPREFLLLSSSFATKPAISTRSTRIFICCPRDDLNWSRSLSLLIMFITYLNKFPSDDFKYVSTLLQWPFNRGKIAFKVNQFC